MRKPEWGAVNTQSEQSRGRVNHLLENLLQRGGNTVNAVPVTPPSRVLQRAVALR